MKQLKTNPSQVILISSLLLVISQVVICKPQNLGPSLNPNQNQNLNPNLNQQQQDRLSFRKALAEERSSTSSAGTGNQAQSSQGALNNANTNNNQLDGSASNRADGGQTAASAAAAGAPAGAFQCPEQFGYYTDTRDCTKYYVCVFGEVLHESCTGGLRFSRELQTCDWPRNVDCLSQQPAATNDSSPAPAPASSPYPNPSTLAPPTTTTTTSSSNTLTTTTTTTSQQTTTAANSNANSQQATTMSTSSTSSAAPAADNSQRPFRVSHNGPATQRANQNGASGGGGGGKAPQSMVFADEGSDPQQPSFDEAVSPVITADGAVHLHDGSGGTFSLTPNHHRSLQAGSPQVQPASLAGEQEAGGGGDQAVNVFVKPLAALPGHHQHQHHQHNSQGSRPQLGVRPTNQFQANGGDRPPRPQAGQQQHQHQQQQPMQQVQPKLQAATLPPSRPTNGDGVGGSLETADYNSASGADEAPTGDLAGAGGNQEEPGNESIGAQADQESANEGANGSSELESTNLNPPSEQLNPPADEDEGAPGDQNQGFASAYIPPVLATNINGNNNNNNNNQRQRQQSSQLISINNRQIVDPTRQTFKPMLVSPAPNLQAAIMGQPQSSSRQQQLQPTSQQFNQRQSSNSNNNQLGSNQFPSPSSGQPSLAGAQNAAQRQSRMSAGFQQPASSGARSKQQQQQQQGGNSMSMSMSMMDSSNGNGNNVRQPNEQQAKMMRFQQQQQQQPQQPLAGQLGRNTFQPRFPANSEPSRPRAGLSPANTGHGNNILISNQPFTATSGQQQQQPSSPAANQLAAHTVPHEQLFSSMDNNNNNGHLPNQQQQSSSSSFNAAIGHTAGRQAQQQSHQASLPQLLHQQQQQQQQQQQLLQQQQQRRPRPPKRQQIPSGAGSGTAPPTGRRPLSSSSSSSSMSDFDTTTTTTTASSTSGSPMAVINSNNNNNNEFALLPDGNDQANSPADGGGNQLAATAGQLFNGQLDNQQPAPTRHSQAGQQQVVRAPAGGPSPTASQRPLVAQTTVSFQAGGNQQQFNPLLPEPSQGNQAFPMGSRRQQQLQSSSSSSSSRAATTNGSSGQPNSSSSGLATSRHHSPSSFAGPATTELPDTLAAPQGAATASSSASSSTSSAASPTQASNAAGPTAPADASPPSNPLDPSQLAANRYLNSAIDALEAGQPFGAVDYDFDILNENSTERRSPVADSGGAGVGVGGNKPPMRNANSLNEQQAAGNSDAARSRQQQVAKSSPNNNNSLAPTSEQSTTTQQAAAAATTDKQQQPTKRPPRPTNKKIQVNHELALANTRASTEPARRPEPVFQTPAPLQTATKCDPRACRLPDCKCGDTSTPGGLEAKSVPQVILLTFDDAVNDLNWEIYEELFSGRTNPNGCPLLATFYVSHEWTDYGQVQTLYSRGHEMASHSVTHSFGEKFSKSQWFKEINGQREILNMYGGVKMNDVRGMRAPFLQIGGNKMFEMLYDANFTYDSSMPIFENSPPMWPYTLDYQMSHECMITPCPTKSFPGVWEVGMTMWVDLRGGRCSMGDACSNPPDEEGVYEMLMKNFNRHYKSNRAPFGLFYHSAWFNTVHHRRGFLRFMGTVNSLPDVFFVTNWQMLQWVRQPTPLADINSFEPWQCPAKSDRPPPCFHPSVCNVKSEHGTRFMKTCQPCPANQQYPWVGATGFKGKQQTGSG